MRVDFQRSHNLSFLRLLPCERRFPDFPPAVRKSIYSDFVSLIYPPYIDNKRERSHISLSLSAFATRIRNFARSSREESRRDFKMVIEAGEFVRQKTVETRDCPSSGSGELHVLAVDDSHVDRKVIERLLKISSCRVTTVESAGRALQYLGLDGEKTAVGFDVNLIMTDYSMPEMTGYELLKKIKKSSALREIPVVIMSSENILARIDSCLEEGAEDFLLKPVKLSDVKRLKDFILRGQGEEDGDKGSCKRMIQHDSMPCDQSSTQLPCPSPPSIQPPFKRPRLNV